MTEQEEIMQFYTVACTKCGEFLGSFHLGEQLPRHDCKTLAISQLEAKQEEINEEYHEHPLFNGQWHKPVWVKIWASGGTNEIEPPGDVPVTCMICGIARGY